MKLTIALLLATGLFLSCNNTGNNTPATSLTGTWKLLTGTIIEKNDTTVTEYSGNRSFIKIINPTHFSFLGHDLGQSKDSSAFFFTAGGGTYTLHDSSYTEHLEYCSDRTWERHDFQFTIHINRDTLVQQGVEKVDSISRLNIERYVRMK